MNELGSADAPRTTPANRGETVDRPAGQLVIDGRAPSSLTPQAIDGYRHAGGSTAVTVRDRDDADAFAALCAGETDLVDSARPMLRAEQARCGAQGRTPLQFTIAADAAVLVTQSESDIGADCLTLGQIRQIFRAGSPIYDWSQLKFDDAALRVGGPQPGARAFSLFGRVALDAAAPSITDVRSDYEAATSAGTLRFVTGDPADAQTAAQRPLAAARVRAATTRAAAAATSQREATAELVAARRDRRKGIADRRPASQQQRARTRLQTAETAMRRATNSRARANQELAQARSAATSAGAAARRQASLRGRIAVLSYRDFSLVSDQVRALEISQRSGAASSCSYPSASSVTTSDYALSQPLLITTTGEELGRTEVQTFLGSYLRHARELAHTAGLVPVPKSALTTQLSWLRDPVATERAAQRDSQR